MYKHPKSFVNLHECEKDKFWPYMPTYKFKGSFINKNHEYYSTGQPCELLGFRGKICPQDACKLYEMAYFADGDILETGTFYGLSTCVMAQACKDVLKKDRKQQRIYTIEKSKAAANVAREHFQQKGVFNFIKQFVGDGTEEMKKLVDQGKKFKFAFIDHDHAYRPTKEACFLMEKLLVNGGFVFFHDFTHPNNKDKARDRCQVWTALKENLRPKFEFFGVYGVAALYKFNG